MRRRRWGIGAELAPLVLILACLAGSFGLIVAAYRRTGVPRSATPRPPALAVAPVVVPAPSVAALPPVARPVAPRPAVVAAPAPPPPEDPTPKALAGLASAEAEQLLEASRANRKAQALEEARQAALVESERWRRRQSLIHSQLDTVESRVRKVEVDLDALALERDALEKEVDAKKAAVTRAKSRPGQAILPHKGPNGTWRRPIIVECRNGAVVIQPQGVEFGLMDLEMGFGPSSNAFVATIAREAIRVQRQGSPDGGAVVPYIFFLVRPDGIRPYYEARGRLETLGITFGYELADADWQVEFPDLDDATTWDGSAPGEPAPPVVAGSKPGSGTSAATEDNDLAAWPGARTGGPGASGPFTFGGQGGGGNGGPGSRPGPAGGGAFDGPIAPRAGSAFAGLRGPGSRAAGGMLAGSGMGTGPGSLKLPGSPTGATRSPASDPGPVPDGYPATALIDAGGMSPTSLGGRPTLGDGTRPGDLGGVAPRSGRGGSRVTASGRIVPGGTGTPGGLPPGGGPGVDQVEAAGGLVARDRAAGQAAGSPGEAPPIELAMDGPTADAPSPGLPPAAGGSRAPDDRAVSSGRNKPTPDADATPVAAAGKPDEADPGATFVWHGDDGAGGKPRPGPIAAGDPSLALPMTNAEREARAGGSGDDPATPATGGGGMARAGGDPGGSGGNQPARRMLGQAAAHPAGQPPAASPTEPPPPGVLGFGLNAPSLPSGDRHAPADLQPPPMPLPSPSSLPNITPPPVALNMPIPRHLPTPTEAGEAVRRQANPAPPPLDWTPPTPAGSVDRTFEIVVVCGPQGVIVQPGSYRITPDALQDREGLFKKQIVALVKNKRLAEPRTPIEPHIRFLIQPRGFDTYRAARSQFFVTGLNWPTSTQVADPDPLVIRSRGVW